MTTFVFKAGLLATAAMLGSVASLPSLAADDFELQAGAPVKDFVSRSMDTTPTTVMVLLSGDSVATVQRNVGRDLTRSERLSIIGARQSEHDAMKWSIERRGGKVLAHLHSALNGIKVTIPKNRLTELLRLPGVVSVLPVGVYQRVNTTSVPLIGAPLAWQSAAHLQGQGVKIAIIDTGIDYTHANFGGPGTVAAYIAAKAANTLPANPALFGPAAPKVKGGTDLVGDAYDGSTTPQPDTNPLDCESSSGSSGHGSHVAGTSAGFGVKSDGTTFGGPYNAAAYTPGAFRIGPGVAPMADLYAVRVFGCQGSTNVVSEAIDWAVANGMNVINMSLGSSFGSANNSEATAIANATAAGILVVVSSGNSGQIPYIAGSPASSDGAIAVAATDAKPALKAGANLLMAPSGATVPAQNSNAAAFANGSNYPIRVLRNLDGTVALGCNPNEYDPAITGIPLTGKVVVTKRGNCARAFKAGAAQHFGAAAALMINTDSGYPPFEGAISGGAATPDDGNIYEPVTIPFFGVRSTDAAAISGPTGGPAQASATATNADIVNPGFERIASFSSSGPRIGDSVLRPSVTAPGVATVSTASGTGNDSSTLSGTSMAAPHVAGVAALVKQANPTWPIADLRAAVVQTASPNLMKDYALRNEGAGLVQAQSATTTQAVMRAPDGNANDSISFGFADLLTDFNATKTVTVHNAGPKAVQFNISVTKVSGPAGTTVTTPATVIVNANSDASFPLTLNVPASAVGGGNAFQDVGGYVQLTPSSSRLNGNVKLSLPYYLVAHSRSNLAVSAVGNTLNLTNAGGAIAGTPTFYTWGLSQPLAQGVAQADVRAVGARVAGANVFFGINTHNRTSTTLAFQEFDVCIDTSGGPGFTPNMVLVGINGSAFGSGAPQNTFTTALFPTDASCNINGGGTILATLTQPTDNSTLRLLAPISSLGLTASSPRFKYTLSYFGTSGGLLMPGVGSFNAFTPALTFGPAPTVAPGGSGSVTVTVNAAELAVSPALGVMMLAPDNVSGAAQAALVP